MLKKCLILECQQKIQRVPYKHICYLQYAQGAITIYLSGDITLSHCEQLKDLENSLPNYFVRINRNVIINLNYLSAYFKVLQKVQMENGKEFDVSRRNTTQLLEKIQPFS
ncbi:LytR/AlgR family response regulator transcription factor [Carboxylicivirga marina]|uniref:LytTR family transcriptional regulator n=1 Tax=Carboxylicivirga marina TaxID=2800988 RepID=A0ABS1HLN8_9BACT|nr:LytTR family DNA-binding domain-containing protein [Carboxylicivirga marina]MBK3518577.1 LytTR family transcriptional regulator [Carboxylicivirga marina]